MNKREMVKMVLDKGILISPDMLGKLNEDTLKTILKDAEQPRNGIVMDEVPNQSQSSEDRAQPKKKQPSESTVSLKIRKHEQKTQLTPGDCAKFYNNKYDALKGILLKKTDAVSINKAGSNQSTISVIGMVIEKTQRGFMLEDPTGKAEIIASPEMIDSSTIAEDDVVAVTGNMKEGIIYGKEIINPDVPLTNKPNELDAKILFSERQIHDHQNSDVICTPEQILAKGMEPVRLGNPAWVDILKYGKSLKLLIYRPDGDSTLLDAVEMLKKRHMPIKRENVLGPNDSFLIDPIPDIFWFVSKEKGFRSYKGVTVVSCGPNAVAAVDLVTRKVVFSG